MALKIRENSITSGLIKDAFLVSFPALLLCLLLDFFAGAFLGKFFTLIRTEYPIILVILPGLMGMRGNIFGAMASRFSTMLYLGEISPSLKDRNVLKNIFLSIVLSLIPVLLLWLVGALKVRNVDVAIAVLLIVLVSTIYASLFLGTATAITTVLPYKKGIDPDSVAAPIITSVADLITIPLLVGFILLYPHKQTFIALTVVSIVILGILRGYSKLNREDLKFLRELLTIIGGLALLSSITGSLLESYSKLIDSVAIFSVMYPMVLDTTGNLGSIIGAKTSTKLHLEGIEKIINLDILKEITVYSLLALPLGIVGNVIGMELTKLLLHRKAEIIPHFILLYPVFVFSVLWFAYFLAIVADRAKLDPDNVTVPTITTLSDVFSTLFIVGIAKIVVG
ncbi:magnesium transporter [Pyrococcus abyssi]|nr:magnesium transporter [Pyrococcus abyssi]